MRNRIPSPGKAGRMLITPESGACLAAASDADNEVRQ